MSVTGPENKAKSAMVSQLIADSEVKKTFKEALQDKLQMSLKSVETFEESAATKSVAQACEELKKNIVHVTSEHFHYPNTHQPLNFYPNTGTTTTGYNIVFTNVDGTSHAELATPKASTPKAIPCDTEYAAYPELQTSEATDFYKKDTNKYKKVMEKVQQIAKETGEIKFISVQAQSAAGLGHMTFDKLIDKEDIFDVMKIAPEWKNKPKSKKKITSPASTYATVEPIGIQVVRQKKKMNFHVMKAGNSTETICGDTLLQIDKSWDVLSAQDSATALAHLIKFMCPDCKENIPGITGA